MVVRGFSKMEVIKIQDRNEGIFVKTRYPGWQHEFKFFMASDGKIKGKDSAGEWLELSDKAGEFIREKILSGSGWK